MVDLEAMRLQAAEARTRLENIRDGYAELQQKLAAVTASATSDDGLVTATVGPQGRLIGVEIDPRIYRRPDSRRLAETITATIQAAAGEAAEKVTELCRPFFPDEEVLAHLNYDVDGVVRHVEDRLIPGGGR